MVDGGSAAAATTRVTGARGPGRRPGEHPRSGSRPLQYRATDDDELTPILTGRRVVDSNGRTMGTITDVVFDPGQYRPVYLVVDPGILRRSHYVPTSGARSTSQGEVMVAWDREWIRLSPPAGRSPSLNDRQRQQVDVHYTLRRP